MFPYISLWWINIYMTGVGIVVTLVTFICISWYFCRKYSIQFWRLFYRLPQAIILVYACGSYVHFILREWLFPTSRQQILSLISPYGYKFHFIWIIIWLWIAMRLFFKKIKRLENKKVYSDVLFFAMTGSLIPLGLFLLLGDDFIGKSTNSIRGVQALQSESALNKFSAVYPIWLVMSIGAAVIYTLMAIWKRITKQIGIGFLGFVYLLILLNIILLYQQYPRYGIIPFGEYTLDIKQYISLIAMVISFRVYRKRKNERQQ